MQIQNQLPPRHFECPMIMLTFYRVLKTMLSIQPVIHHLIAIGFAFLALGLLSQVNLFPPGIVKYLSYSPYVVYGLILYQIMKAATRSLFISCVVILLSGAGFMMAHIEPGWHAISTTHLQYCMLLGVTGLVISVFAIK